MDNKPEKFLALLILVDPLTKSIMRFLKIVLLSSFLIGSNGMPYFLN